MCSGGRLLADFEAGTWDQPDVPEMVARCLTSTVDDRWVVWAYKLAHRAGRDFRPLSDSASYPTDAVAQCRHGGRHPAPQPTCSCGFHALSSPWPGLLLDALGSGLLQLDVALTGRVLAFEWQNAGVLFRAARQTVVRVNHTEPAYTEPDWTQTPRRPDDPDDRLARSVRRQPRGAGPFRLQLPDGPAPCVLIADDAGYCSVQPMAVTPRRVAPAFAGV